MVGSGRSRVGPKAAEAEASAKVRSWSASAKGNGWSATSDVERIKEQHKRKSTVRKLYEAVKQQRLAAQNPNPTIRVILPFYLGVGAVFVPLGVVLWLASASVKEHRIDYGNCTNPAGQQCSNFLRFTYRTPKETAKPWASRQSCNCTLDFELDEDFAGDVYFYYGLSHFYQNHRLFFKSFSAKQLLGTELDDLGSCAAPFDGVPTGEADGSVDPYLPCGAKAAARFNDTFTLWYQAPASSKPDVAVPLTWRDTVAPSQLRRYSPVPPAEAAKYRRPPSWPRPAHHLNDNYTHNNGFPNSDFVNWMQTSAVHTFRKLWRRLDRSGGGDFAAGLKKAKYQLEVGYNFPVDYRHFVEDEDPTKNVYAHKYFIIATVSWAGGKGKFLSIAYLVTGVFSVLLGLLSFCLHKKFGRWGQTEQETKTDRSLSVATVQALQLR